MAKTHEDDDDHHYKRKLRALQIELVKLQRQLIADGARVLVILEGRDSAGKDGAIKRITEHMSPRETRVHAPGKPSSREETQWYFQRFVPFLPAGEEFVIFNRSWYNRAGVERVMGYCTDKEAETFFESVVPFENAVDARGNGVAQILSRHLQTRAEESSGSSARRSPEAVEDLARRRGGAGQVARLFQGARRDVRTHQPQDRAVARRRRR